MTHYETPYSKEYTEFLLLRIEALQRELSAERQRKLFWHRDFPGHDKRGRDDED